MTAGPPVTLVFTRVEAVHLRGLIGQFVDLLIDTKDAAADPAVARLVPSAYPDDSAAAEQFRATTQAELLRRRTDDAAVALADLTSAGELTLDGATTSDGLDNSAFEAALAEVEIVLDRDRLGAWLRTLSAVRLVLASRLGIVEEDDHDESDPRFAVYEWLAARLDALVRAAETD